jgi:hypothetical protein
LKTVKETPRLFRLCFASTVGGVFAVIFPLIVVNEAGRYALKWITGFILSFLAFGRIKNKNDVGRYALSTLSFFVSTFLFGGAITALGISEKNTFLTFLLFGGAVLIFAKGIYKRRSVARFFYDCEIQIGANVQKIKGFYDTGNLARFENIPVCFLSPDCAYRVIDEEKWGEFSQKIVCISTLGGEKKLPLFSGIIRMKNGEKSVEKSVYFAVAGHMVKREYQLILHSEIFE